MDVVMKADERQHQNKDPYSIKNILLFAWPIMLANLLQISFNFADTLVVGNFVSEKGLAAVGSAAPLIVFFTWGLNGLSLGADVLISRMIGAKDHSSIPKAVYSAICIAIVFGTFIGLFGFFMLSEFTKATVSYYWWGPGKVWHRRICLLSEMAASFAVVFFLFVLGMKIRIGNRFLDLMGKITLEFYLIHGLFVELFARKFADKLKSVHFFENNLLYVALVFVLALPSALILKKLRDLVFGRRKSGKKEAKGMEKA